MLLSRLLTQPNELAQFATDYQCQAYGVTIQPNYLQRAQVRVFYRPFQPKIYLAGFVINPEAPLRYFMAPGEVAKRQTLEKINLQESDLVEIGAIWFSRYQSAVRSFHRVQFYSWMMYDAWRTRRPVLLGGSFIQQVQGQQRVVLPILIYQDIVKIGIYTGSLQLYIGYRKGMWMRLVKALVIDIRRRRQQSTLTSADPTAVKLT